MNGDYARRYHWVSNEKLNFIVEPHSAIVFNKITKPLNLTAKKCKEARKCSANLVKENPLHLKKYLKPHVKLKSQRTLFEFPNSFKMPKGHFPEIDANMTSSHD